MRRSRLLQAYTHARAPLKTRLFLEEILGPRPYNIGLLS